MSVKNLYKKLHKWTFLQLITILYSKIVYGDSSIGKNKCIKKMIYPILEKHRKQQLFPQKDSNSNHVWLLWWQGEKEMPDMVKMCYHSVLNNFKGVADVTLLTEENINDYVSLPSFIEQKRLNGQITLTHYSDIVRFHVMNKYGGLWIDATYFISRKVDKSIFQKDIYTIVNPHPSSKNNNDYIWYNWTGNLIKLPPQSNLGTFVEECFLFYWKNHTELVDYYLIDHLIRIAYDEIVGVKDSIKGCGYSNLSTHKLLPWLNRPYDEEIYKRIIKDTTFFKLTTKQNYLEYADGKLTLYGFLKTRSQLLSETL